MEEKKKRFSDYLSVTDNIFYLFSIFIMPVIIVMDAILYGVNMEIIKHAAIWITIQGGFVLLHIRLRVYKFEMS